MRYDLSAELLDQTPIAFACFGGAALIFVNLPNMPGRYHFELA
jgi:hypothetical protein